MLLNNNCYLVFAVEVVIVFSVSCYAGLEIVLIIVTFQQIDLCFSVNVVYRNVNDVLRISKTWKSKMIYWASTNSICLTKAPFDAMVCSWSSLVEGIEG